VFANDLNPESAKYLALNVQLNRVGARVLPFNMDGRQFVRLLLATPGGPVEQLPPAPAAAEQAADQQPQQQQLPQQQQQQQADASNQQQQQQPKRKLVAEVPPAVPPGFRPPPGGLHFQHAVMNLPASAVEFMDAFNGAFDPASWAGQQLPLVHVYTFMKNETEAGEAGAVGCYGKAARCRMVVSCIQLARGGMCGATLCCTAQNSCTPRHLFALTQH
jgi:tRNA (guanine37-N1)-methyltransferase